MKSSCGWYLAVVLLVVGCGDNHDHGRVDAAIDAAPNLVARGQYIANVLGACTFCHTPLLDNGQRDLDNLFAGVDCFIDLDSATFVDNENGTGCLSTRNLTNHATGLANATDAAIKNAFQNGVRTDGKKIVPLMPYWVFHNMTDEDADAVVAYLRTVEGRDNTVKANEPPFSLYNDGIIDSIPPFIPGEVKPIPEALIPLPRGGANNESGMRGRYLTSMAGLCIDCHTPDIAPGSIVLDMTRPYGGGRVFPKGALGLIDPAFPPAIVTRNLTPHTTGLGGWTRDQIKLAIADGRDKDNNQVCAATHGGETSPYAALDPQDLDDIVEYIFSLPEVEHDTAAVNCGAPPMPFAVGQPESGIACTTPIDDDGDGTVNDGCPETGNDCTNATDDDDDGVPNDGCYVPCGNCAGPPVP